MGQSDVVINEELESSVRAAIARLNAAMAMVANGDVSAIRDLYSHTAEATSFYGWGGYEKGWEAVSRRWDWAGAQFKGGSVRHENISTIITPEMFYVTDIETFEGRRVASVDGTTGWSNRVTHVSAAKQASGVSFTATLTGWNRSTSRPPDLQQRL